MLEFSNVFYKNVDAYKNDNTKYIINQGGTSCFCGEQEVITSCGNKPISKLKVGDIVLSHNEKTGKDEFKRVKNVFRYRNTKETYDVLLKNGHRIKATSDHKFFCEGGCNSLKGVVLLHEKEKDNGNLEKDTTIQQIRSVGLWTNTLNKLQKLWENKTHKASTCKRRVFSNNAKRRQREVLFLEDTQVCCNCISWQTKRERNKSQRRKQEKQLCFKSRVLHSVRKHFARLQKLFDKSKAWFFEWYGKTFRGGCKENKRSCKKWWSVLWEKVSCRKIWSIRSTHKGYSEYAKRYLEASDIKSYRTAKIPFVYDIEVEDNHNYYLWTGFKCLVHNSTKTYSILQLLTVLSIKYPFKIDIVGLSVPHLKSGVLNDMQSICLQMGFEFDEYYKEGDKVFKYGQGTINFLAFDKLGKAHGGRRDVLYLNEANHLNYNIAEQLMIRTRQKVFIDYNPTNAFWVHKNIMVNEPEKARLIKSTYKDNPFLEQSIIDSIESRRGDGNNNFWRVYGMGELGIAEGLIFNNFEIKDFDINSFGTYRNGVDWGFSQDPFAFTRSAKENNCLYICKEIYQKGLLNKESAPLVKEIVRGEIVRCDSAEPKSVAEFRQLGINAISVKKGAGSVESGIKFLQSFEHIYIHPSCHNVYDEFCNYQWRMDKNWEAMPEPIDAYNHAIDSLRYAWEDDMSFRKARAIDIDI